jgi:two-component system, NtrC family, sensor kinase
MLERESDLERIRASAGVLRLHIGRISRTLRDMTNFARRRGEEGGPVAISAAIEDALRMVRHDPRARRVRIAVEIAPSMPRVHIVEDHLVMVLVNLILNAFDAMPQGGDLVVAADPVAGGVHVLVRDTGCGMDEQVRLRATEPLFTTKPGGRGTGLGLSVSADVIVAAGGTLEIESSPGAGTTVHLRLPEERESWQSAS